MSSATTRFLLLLIAATATSTGALRRHSKANSSKFDVKQASQSANGTSSCTYVNTKGRTLVINGMIMMECSGYGVGDGDGGNYYFEKDGFFWYEGDRVAKISGSGCDASFDWRGEAWQKAGCWVRRYPVMNEGNTVATYTGVEETDCQSRCFQNPSCSSFSYTPSDGPKSICKLKDQTVKAEDPSTPKYLRHRTYFQVARPGSSWQGIAPSPPSFDIPPACDEKLSEPKGADYRGCQNRGSKASGIVHVRAGTRPIIGTQRISQMLGSRRISVATLTTAQSPGACLKAQAPGGLTASPSRTCMSPRGKTALAPVPAG